MSLLQLSFRTFKQFRNSVGKYISELGGGKKYKLLQIIINVIQQNENN